MPPDEARGPDYDPAWLQTQADILRSHHPATVRFIEDEARALPAPVAGADEAWERLGDALSQTPEVYPVIDKYRRSIEAAILHDARERGLDVERLNDVLVNLFPWWDEDKYPNRHADRIAADYNDRLSTSVPLPGETP